tara:strand:- start:331 stop:1236 length:906 start_codon:yes stop_codon:yes gene_type:complete
MKPKILVIGGTGFIGQNLISFLSKRKFNITSISRNFPKKKFKIKGVQYKKIDITKKILLKKKINTNYDFIINCSGYIDHSNKKGTIQTHFNGGKNLVQFFASKKIKRFIQIGSSLEYGKKRSPQSETDEKYSSNYYAKSKLKLSNYLRKIYKKKRFPFIVLRLYQVYGPYQKKNRLIPFVIDSCIKNRKFPCSDGKQIRDFLYIDDLSNLILNIINRTYIKSKFYNIGTNKPKSVRNVINLISKIVKKGKPEFGKKNMRKDEILKLYPNIRRVVTELKWKPNIKLKTGLKRTINFYKKIDY